MTIRIIFLCFFLTGCSVISTKTVVPPAVEAAQPSWDRNQQNSGIISIDEEGYHVTARYLERYDSMLKLYGTRLEPPVATGDRRGITAEGEGYIFTAEARARFTLMNQWRRDDAR